MVIASLDCRALKIPSIGWRDDFGMVVPGCLIELAPHTFAGFNKALLIILKEKKSEFGTFLESPGRRRPYFCQLVAGHRYNPKARGAGPGADRSRNGILSSFTKIGWKFIFPQTAAMGSFGRAALRPIYGLIANGGGRLSRELKDCLEWWERVLPPVTPRFIWSYDRGDLSEPARIYSDSAGGGEMASVIILPRSTQELPVALKGTADGGLNSIAASTNPIYIYELFATAATTFQMREQLTGRGATLFVGNEAACAAPAKGTAKNKRAP